MTLSSIAGPRPPGAEAKMARFYPRRPGRGRMRCGYARSARARVHPAEQQRLGDDGVAERVEVQRLVRAVRARMRILHPGHEDLRAGIALHEVGDERDGAAHAVVDRILPVPVAPRVARQLHRPAARVDEETVAAVDLAERQLRAE